MAELKSNRKKKIDYRVFPKLPGSDLLIDYPLIEGTGTTIHDRSGNEHHASVTLNNTTEDEFWGGGPMLEGGVDFQGEASVNMSDTITIGSSWTWEIFFTFRQTSQYTYLIQYEYSTGDTVYIRTDDTNNPLTFADIWATGASWDLYRTRNRLNHIIVTYKSEGGIGARRLYHNGAMIRQDSFDNGAYPDITDLNFSNLGSWQGKLLGFRLYDRALNPEELFNYGQELTKLGIIQSPTSWYDDSWNEQQIIDPNNKINTLPAQDLTGADAPAPSRDDVLAIHNGTNPGLYRSDSANNQWVKVEDNTTTIAY